MNLFHLVSTGPCFSLLQTADGYINEASLLGNMYELMISKVDKHTQSNKESILNKRYKAYVEIILEYDDEVFTLTDAPKQIKETWEVSDVLRVSVRKLSNFHK